MNVTVKRIKIFKIKNRRGYAALCLNHLTEGKTLFQAYERMLKALRRSAIVTKGNLTNIKQLITTV